MRHTGKSGKTRPCFVAAGLLALLAFAAVAQERPIRVEVQDRFDAALRLYQQGDLDKAAAALDEVLKMEPTSREALVLRERVGMDRLVRMLKEPKVGQAVRILLRKAAEEAKHIRRDPKEIQRLVEEMGSDDVVVRWSAIRQLTATGPFAVPYLLDHALSDEQPSEVSRRVAAVIAIRHMGISATPPLAAALRFADDQARARIAGLIADNPDVRAVPPLLAILEDRERPDFVRRAVRRALERIFGQERTTPAAPVVPAAAYPSAAEAHLALALRYYYADPTLLELTPLDERVLWRWNPQGPTYGERLFFQDVPAYVYARARAEELILEGARQRNAPAALLELYICNNYLQLEEALARGAAADLPADEAAEARERAERLKVVHSINESLGTPYLYGALARALNDGDTALARRCVEALRNVGDSRVPRGTDYLVAALSYPDKLVRVSAAETLMRLHPAGDLPAAVEVARVTAAGLGVRPMETIVVLTGSDPFYAKLARLLAEWKFIPERRAEATEALNRLKAGIPPASLLVLDARTEGIATETFLTSLRRDAQTERLPVVVLAPPEQMERLQDRCGKMATVLSLEAEPPTIKAALDAALAAQPPPGGTDVRENADLVRRVLSTLAALPPGTRYPVQSLGLAAGGLINGYPDDIRILALRATANLGSVGMKDAVYGVYADADQPLEVRREAGAALVRLLTASPDLEPDQRARLREMGSDPDPVLRAQAWHALAIASVPPAERVEALRRVAAP